MVTDNRYSSYRIGEQREMVMYIAGRLRELRVYKNLSQGDIEKRTGLLRCYISRVENGHTVPALETLEKFARALEVPLYQLFYEIEESPVTKPRSSVREKDWASQGKGFRIFTKMCSALSRMSERDRQILLGTAAQFRNGNDARKS
jgi:transcriptional regulator with XRE-family HTH domain